MRTQTHKIENVFIEACFSSVGKKEADGPLGEYFDAKYEDDMLGQKSWEMAESLLFGDLLPFTITLNRPLSGVIMVIILSLAPTSQERVISPSVTKTINYSSVKPKSVIPRWLSRQFSLTLTQRLR